MLELTHLAKVQEIKNVQMLSCTQGAQRRHREKTLKIQKKGYFSLAPPERFVDKMASDPLPWISQGRYGQEEYPPGRRSMKQKKARDQGNVSLERWQGPDHRRVRRSRPRSVLLSRREWEPMKVQEQGKAMIRLGLLKE